GLGARGWGGAVVAARNEAAEEVAGDAAVLVNPLDPDAIAAGIAEASERREELRQLGLERAASFSWAEAARATVEGYREAAGCRLPRWAWSAPRSSAQAARAA